MDLYFWGPVIRKQSNAIYFYRRNEDQPQYFCIYIIPISLSIEMVSEKYLKVMCLIAGPSGRAV